MQRDVYNIMTQGFNEPHMHHLHGIQQGGASALISRLQSLGAGFQEQIQKADLEFKKFIKDTKLTSLMAWKYWRADYYAKVEQISRSVKNAMHDCKPEMKSRGCKTEVY